MGRTWRWGVLAALVAALVAVPLVVGVLPAGSTTGDAAALLARIRAASDRPYSGYAESTGALALPASDDLDAVSSLLGGRTQVRVWFRSAADWRADTLTATGETSTRSSAAGTALWDYEANRVVLTAPDASGAAGSGGSGSSGSSGSSVRFPRASDLLPPELADRLLSEATPDLVSALPARLVAGRPADGLRLTPDEPLSSIDHVDVWADRASAVPVLVDVLGRGGGSAAVSATFLDFTDATPVPADTAFTPPTGARVRTGQRFDLVRSIGQVEDPGLPDALLGLPRTAPAPGLEGIGQYGRGVTQFAVGVLPGGTAASLREQLTVASGARVLPEGIAVTVGPLALLLTDPSVTGQTWLLTGTLTPEGLAQAATALRAAT